MPRKRSKPEFWDDIDIRTDAETPCKKPTCDSYVPFPPLSPSTKDEVDKDFLNLIKNTDSCIAIDFDESESDSDYEAPKSVFEIVDTIDKPRSVDDIMGTFQQETTSEVISDIFKLTTAQSESGDWFKYRQGRITGLPKKLLVQLRKVTTFQEICDVTGIFNYVFCRFC